jgi:hypothetical protein
MNVAALEPDAPAISDAPVVTPLERQEHFQNLLDVAGAALERADAAERAFSARRGGLVEMMVERASADAMLQLASSAAQRTTQALTTLFGMQV